MIKIDIDSCPENSSTLPLNNLSSFETWLSERPKWLQTAAADLLHKQTKPDDAALIALTDLCFKEAIKTHDAVFASIPTGSFNQPTVSTLMHIDKLDKVVGVNAISSDSKLVFGTSNLHVVYGNNGSGKSGYARLLKHACGSSMKQDLLPNVFSTTTINPSVEISITSAGVQKNLSWSLSMAPLNELRHVHIFDSHTAASYINAKNEACYEPRRMRFISTLIAICDRVAELLGNKKNILISAMPQMPTEFVATSVKEFINSLNHKTLSTAIDKACAMTTEESAERVRLELLMKQSDVAGKLKQLAQTKQRVTQLKTEFETLKNGLANEKFEQLISLRKDAKDKRKVATEDADKIFANASLTGVGQDSWKLMWEEARKYSNDLAYPEHHFPMIGNDSRCVLCQQELNEDAKLRLTGFESYVKGNLEASAKKAENLLKAAIDAFPSLIKKEDWNSKIEILNVDPSIAGAIFQAINAQYELIAGISEMGQLTAIDWSEFDQKVGIHEQQLIKEEATFIELQQADKRTVYEKQLNELKAREWLIQNRVAVEQEIVRKQEIKRFESAEALCKTNALTSKKNELTKEELSLGYQKRFYDELKYLGGERIPVSPTSVPEGKGKIKFELKLIGTNKPVSTNLILSEGETRIVSLAAFLADITGSGQPTPFVFDDPISSLDQDFEEKVVERLAELSKTRQVIVFTHRLSLLVLLDDAVQRIAKSAEAQDNPPIQMSLTGLHRMGKNVGIVGEIKLREKKLKSAIQHIHDHILPKLRKAYDNNEVENYEIQAKAACTDFRILTERCVETILLNDVVSRFRRSLQTMGKLGSLAKIQKSDCDLIDQMMTRYSCFEHSQPIEIPITIPSPEELTKDVKGMIDWITEFEKRT
ncbi:AAA family ATPase [Undibacterium flavidum]|uniref:Chromosome segregation protein SMC n=1 Tax=Undibacterium flavidum TaxID=2762297 RepID=A0ABR6Y792_9BURK|nr:chromosome segregation protein SMC [Undibacterium flavidum]MBC3872481.1 chromosome segregation protein SMC [Undibacterium flavidum]